mgnify:FL=1
MGENRGTTETKRMTSIVRKLHLSWIGRKLSMYVGWDFFLFVVLTVGWLCDQEITRLGGIKAGYQRSIENFPSIKKMTYVVRNGNGKVLMDIEVYHTLLVIGILLAAVLVIQLLNLCTVYAREEQRIRHILAPINEIALKADELSKMTFSEDKYQQIEEAISSLQPEESELLSFGDSDLQGIEAAMNNLLVRMRDSYRQQARFVNDASHELRTPIAVIQGYANMLARWGSRDEKVLKESIEAIQHESEHMKYLVEQLLFLARGDSGKTKLNLETVYLDGLMEEIYEESLMIDENHIYRFVKSEEKPGVQADSALLKQAVRILVDNAAKYTHEGDEIILSFGKTKDSGRYLQGQDTGIGMAEADVEHMFERFYRADEVRSRQGTGLGLAIAKWIIDKHKGYFEILSRTELGTRVRIILPDRPMEKEA